MMNNKKKDKLKKIKRHNKLLFRDKMQFNGG